MAHLSKAHVDRRRVRLQGAAVAQLDGPVKEEADDAWKKGWCCVMDIIYKVIMIDNNNVNNHKNDDDDNKNSDNNNIIYIYISCIYI